MDGVIAIKDLAFFIMFTLVSVVCVFIIVVLFNFSKLLVGFNKIIEDNKTNIDKTMNILPEAANNMNDAAVSMKNTIDKAGLMLGTVDDTVSGVASSFEDTSEDVFEVLKMVVGTVKTVIALFSKD